MATPTASGYTQSIRQNLVNKGINNADIGYNPQTGYVTIKGQDAIKSGKNYQGTNYTTQFGFNSDWDKYQKSLQQQQPAAATTQTYSQPQSYTTQQSYSYNPYQTNNPYDNQLNETIQMLMNRVNNQQPVDVNAIYNSPQYAAYQAQAQKGAQQGIRAAQEAMGAAGFGRSTALGERAQGIQNDANEYLNTQVLPQLMAAEEQRRQQTLNNQLSMLNQLFQQQGVYDNRYNTSQNLALDKGRLMGSYVPPEAYEYINQVLQSKENYKNAQTPEERARYNSEANNARAILSMLGLDNVDSLIGSGVNLENALANRGKLGIKTLEALNQEYNQASDQRDFNVEQEQRELENQWLLSEQTGVISPYIAKLYGIPEGTPTQSAKQFAMEQAVRQQNADRLLSNSARGRSSGGSGGGSSNPKPINLNSIIDNIDRMYTKYNRDTGSREVINKDGLKDYIESLGLPEDQKTQVYALYGLSSGSGGSNFWEITKNVLSNLAKGTGSQPSVSDEEIKQWLEN